MDEQYGGAKPDVPLESKKLESPRFSTISDKSQTKRFDTIPDNISVSDPKETKGFCNNCRNSMKNDEKPKSTNTEPFRNYEKTT